MNAFQFTHFKNVKLISLGALILISVALGAIFVIWSWTGLPYCINAPSQQNTIGANWVSTSSGDGLTTLEVTRVTGSDQFNPGPQPVTLLTKHFMPIGSTDLPGDGSPVTLPWRVRTGTYRILSAGACGYFTVVIGKPAGGTYEIELPYHY